MKLYDQYAALSLDGALFGFEKGSCDGGYYCTPRGMKVFGWDNGIHFGTVRGYRDCIFAVNPEAYENTQKVFLLAENFRDFLSLILSAGHTAAIEQIVSFPFTREQYEEYVKGCVFSAPTHSEAMAAIEGLGIERMPDAYGYVTELQKRFDPSKLRFTDEYYDAIGEMPPKTCKRGKKTAKTETACDFFSVSTVQISHKKEEN